MNALVDDSEKALLHAWTLIRGPRGKGPWTTSRLPCWELFRIVVLAWEYLQVSVRATRNTGHLVAHNTPVRSEGCILRLYSDNSLLLSTFKTCAKTQPSEEGS